MIKRLLGLNLNFWAGFPIVEGGGGGGGGGGGQGRHGAPLIRFSNVITWFSQLKHSKLCARKVIQFLIKYYLIN